MKSNLFLSFLLVSLFFSEKLFAQEHKLVKLWESDTLLKVPESVLLDKKRNVLYTSNIDGQAWEKDGKGSIGKLTTDGKILAAEWISGFHAPKGLGMYKGELYVADVDEVVVIDIDKSQIARRIKVEGAQGLNDLTVGEDGTLYVSDSKAFKMYMIKGDVPTLYFEKLQGPNGVLMHNKALYVLDKGGLYKIENDKSLLKLADGMECNADGVEHVQNNEFIASCWQGAIWYLKGDGSKQLLLDTREQKMNTADIGYDAASRILYVPTFLKNNVVAYRLQ